MSERQAIRHPTTTSATAITALMLPARAPCARDATTKLRHASTLGVYMRPRLLNAASPIAERTAMPVSQNNLCLS